MKTAVKIWLPVAALLAILLVGVWVYGTNMWNCYSAGKVWIGGFSRTAYCAGVEGYE